MAQVPQYQRSVAPQVTHDAYQRVNLNGDMFGANVSKALGNVGNSLSNLGDSMAAIKTRVDDTKILGLVNFNSEWEEKNLTNKENGYYYKTGKDAYGQSETLLKDYDKQMNDYIQKARLSPSAAARANDTYRKMRDRIQQGITSHDFKQGVAWSNTEAETSKMNYINNAITLRNDPDAISNALMSGYQIIEWQGEIQKLDEATIRLQKIKYRSQVHENVLNAYLGEGSLKATEYLEKHKAEISPERLPQYIQAVKSNDLTYTARQTAAKFVGMPIADVYENINAIDDPETRDAVMKEYNILTNQQENIQKEQNAQIINELTQSIQQAIDNNENPALIKQKIMASDLPFEVKQKQIQYVNDCLELGQEVSLWNEIEALENMRLYNFEEFQKEDLSKYALTKDEREKYLKLQKEVVNYSTEQELRKLVGEFDTFFWAGKNSLDSGVYKDELIGVLAKIERMQGAAFDIDNLDKNGLQAIIDGFGFKNDTVANKNIDETKELYMRAKAVAEIQERVAQSYMTFKSANKREPEPEEMFYMVQKIYNDVGRETKARIDRKKERQINMHTRINNAEIKKVGYTKVLTNFEEFTIPDLEKQTGVKMNITSTYRSGAKYGHEKGIKADIFPANPTKANILKSAEYLISSPDVEVIFTSNPYVLSRYGTNPKVQDARKYDASAEAKKAGIQHVTHFDIKLSSKFGGTEQMKQTYLSQAPSNQQLQAAR